MNQTRLGCVLFATTASFNTQSLDTVISNLRKKGVSNPIGLTTFPSHRGDALSAPAGVDFLSSMEIGFLNWSPFEDSVLLDYEEFRHHPLFQQIRFLGLKLLNRNDLTGSLRFLDREVIFVAAVMGALTILRSRAPAILVFDVTPHQFLQYTFWQVAQWLEIPILYFQPAGVGPFVLPKTTLETAAALPEELQEQWDSQDECLAIFENELSRLETGMDPPYMVSQKARDIAVHARKQKLRSLKASAKALFKPATSGSLDFTGHTGGTGIFWNAFRILLTRSLGSSLKSRLEQAPLARKPSKKFAIFALHYEPERTSLPEGLPIDFQADAVVSARNILPQDYHLLLKEHYSQSSRALRGWTGRSPLLYDYFSKFPGTHLLDTNLRLSDFLFEAQIVFTLTGSIAIEAALRGTPVGYFGNPWWAGMPGTSRVEPNTAWEQLSGSPAADPLEAKKFLRAMVESKMFPGIGGENIANATRRFGSLPADLLRDEAHGIAACVLQEISKPITQPPRKNATDPLR